MKRLKIPVVAALLLVLVLLAAQQGLGIGSASRPGELAFSTETIDMGQVPLDQTVSYRYEMQNVGDKPVTIVGTPQVRAVEGC